MRGRAPDKSANWVWSEAGLNPDETSQNVKEEYCQEGYLDKQGQSVASFWKRRYVGCTKTEIQYFGDKKYAHNKHAQKGQNQTPHTLSKETPACLPLIGLIRGRRDSDR